MQVTGAGLLPPCALPEYVTARSLQDLSASPQTGGCMLIAGHREPVFIRADLAQANCKSLRASHFPAALLTQQDAG